MDKQTNYEMNILGVNMLGDTILVCFTFFFRNIFCAYLGTLTKKVENDKTLKLLDIFIKKPTICFNII